LKINFLRNIFQDYVDEFREVIRPVVLNKRVQAMRDFEHHGDICCFAHCLRVAKHSYSICRALGLDSQSAARGAMLHDFFLYDRYEKGVRPVAHLLRHPLAALDEASVTFDLNKTEMNIIKAHMWPLSLSRPKYAESIIVSFVDKYIAFKEYSLLQAQALRRLAVSAGRAVFHRKSTAS